MSEKAEILTKLLEDNGYAKNPSGNDVVWTLINENPSAAVNARIEILERKKQYHISKCQIHIDLEKLSEKIRANVKKRIPRLVSWVSFIEPDGRIRTIAEIAPTGSAKRDNSEPSVDRQTNMGTSIGWTTSISLYHTDLTVQFTDAFMLGDPVKTWWADLAASVSEAIAPFSLKAWDARHLREIQLPITAIGTNHPRPKAYRKPISELSEIEAPIPFKIHTDNRRIQIVVTTDPVAQIETSLEILEARETSERWRNLDARIVHRKPLILIEKPLTDDVDILARVAAAPEIDIEQTGTLESLINKTKLEGQLLALTGAIKIAVKSGRSEDSLNLLSDMIRQISNIYGPIETTPPLSRIVPEVLGDTWALVNPKMAYRAWEAALELSKQNPRIHRKISKLAMGTGDFETELNALLNILSIERRKQEISRVSERLVGMMLHEPDKTKPRREEINSALERAISLMPDNPKLAHSIAEVLAANGRHREALTALDGILGAKLIKLTPELTADINFSMARIWHLKENNLKLATARYINATSLAAKLTDEQLEEAENFFISSGREELAQKMLKMRSQQPDQISRLRALERSVKYHIDNQNLKAAADDILNILAEGTAKPWFRNILETNARDTPESLNMIVSTMFKANIADLPREDQLQWTLSAARLALADSDLRKIGIKILQEGRIIQLLGPDEVYAVTADLIKSKKSKELSDFITCRLSFSKPEETKNLLNIIVEHNLLSLDGLYENAIADHAAASKNLSISKNRVQAFVSLNRAIELKTILTAHEAALAGSALINTFQEFVLDEICKSGNLTFSELLEELAAQRMSDPAMTAATKKFVVQAIIKSGFVNLGTRLLVVEIQSGNSCIEDESVIESLIGSDAITHAKWHEIERLRTEDKQKRLHHAQKSLALWLTTNERPSTLIDLISETGDHGCMSIQNLELLEFLCTRDKRIEKWLAALTAFINRASTEEQDSLVHWGIRIINSHLDKPEMAADFCLNFWSHKEELNLEELFTIGVLYFQNSSLLNAQSYLLRILNNPEVLLNKSLLLASLDTLARCRLDKAHFTTVTQTLLSWSRAGSNEELTIALVDRSIEWQVAGSEDLNHKFLNDFNNETADRLANMATQIIGKAERSGMNIGRLLAEWSELLSSGRQMSKWWEMIALLHQDRFIGQLKRPSRSEIIYLYARHLFDSDMSRFDSIPIFESLAIENPMDSRSWIPLYSLYEETNSRQKLIAHLEHVIPLIQKDRSVLEQTPFTLESLKNSLKRARGSTHGAFEMNFEKIALQKQKDFDIQERAARMQKAWLAASPAVQISLPAVASGDTDNTSTPDNIISLDLGQSSLQSFDAGAAMALSSETLSEQLPQFNDAMHTEQTESQVKLTLNLAEESKTGQVVQMNWRDLVQSEKTAPGSTERIMTMAFASDIEKHVAVQCSALLNGEMRALDAWHWQAWRRPETCDYSQSPKGRLPDLDGLKHYGGALHKLLRLVAPILTRAARRKFMIDSKLQELGLPATVNMTTLDFDHPIIERCALSYFKPHIDMAKMRFIDTPGMGGHVFFDLRTIAIHFDANWQAKLPRTVLANKIIEIIISNQRGQPALIELNPVTDIIPIVEEISNVLTSSGLSRLQIAFGVQHREISQELRNINKEQLVSLLSVAGKPSMRDIKQLQHEMRLKNLATVLASTLDVVGLLESLSGQDLCETGVMTPKSIFKVHHLAKDVLNLATKLTI